MKIELENCQKSLTLKDFEEVESKLGHVLPERLKEFYLQYNGGEPKQQTIIRKSKCSRVSKRKVHFTKRSV